MITLYHGAGAGDFELLRPKFNRAENDELIFNAKRVLAKRGFIEAAKLLSFLDFIIWDGTNDFSDYFCVLHADAPLDKYEIMRKQLANRAYFKIIAEVLSEIGPYIRFVSCELEMENGSTKKDLGGLAYSDILKLVNEYIGVHGGYLGDFSYRSHEEFYPQFCEMEIDPSAYGDTTRERFIGVLRTVNPKYQAKIIQGTLKKYPIGSQSQRTQNLYDYFNSLAMRLAGSVTINAPNPTIDSDVLKRALDDAETLIQNNGAISAVDRIHTALHSYLKAVCNKAKIEYESNPSITQLFKVLKEKHPAFTDSSTCSEEINKILKACSVIIDALNPVRNRASVAHPNDVLLGDEEALLVVNVTRSLLHYIDSKISSYS